MSHHLVILKRPYLDAIVSGRKQIESRFWKTRRAPFGMVDVGDTLFLKASSGPVCATAKVGAVKRFEELDAVRLSEIKRRYNNEIGGSEQYWASKRHCRYGLLVWLKDVRAIPPMRIDKKDWRAWVVLTEREDFGLLQEGIIAVAP